ncbi:vitamin K epoxide reductase family protein [Chryseobacterium paridis]|uniref:Thioredoxin domain-containing protein n=1 Tax=Chryseobacterium paridis TaxID=2800328 RepID=A0ABS1FUN2_9FLAO|nr:vitamin K epoxide reductase family protein [Chryseobacterium paridis]MBK1896138.1 thioredoxin domain-containing protein [Chryseobacterium paridis]
MKIENLIKNLKIDQQEFFFQFQSHPNYPSALALSDTLNFMGITNNAYHLNKQYWHEIKDEFIIIYKDAYSLIKKEKNGYRIYSNEIKIIPEKELHQDSEDFVLLFEKDEITEKKHFLNFNKLVYILFTLYAIYSLVLFSWVASLFNILSIIGLYLSYEIFNQKFGRSAPLINNICGIGSHFNEQTSCHKVIDIDSINFFGLKLSDFSLIYFVSISILGLFNTNISAIVGVLTLMAIPFLFYSIYIQSFVVKTFCRVCLLIISILGCQIFISISFFIDQEIYWLGVGLILLIFATTSILIWGINSTLNTFKEIKNSNIKNLKFKRNYKFFKSELLESDKILFDNNPYFLLGNKNANLNISIISNPYCSFCMDAHLILEKILNKYPNDISVQIRFNYSKDQSTEYTNLLSTFIQSYKFSSEAIFLLELKKWFLTKDLTKLTPINKTISFKEELNDLHEISLENGRHSLNFTPFFIINGHLFPDKYDREEIFYFIDEMLEDLDFIKSK